MNRLLEVKEFDRITCDPRFKDSKTEYKYLPKQDFLELKGFIQSFESAESQADALEFSKIGFHRDVGEILTINNYVGLIQMQNGFQIQVLPKVDFGEGRDKGSAETKKVFLRMLRSMKDFPSKVFKDANLRMDKMPLYEIFINMFLQETRELVKRGIKSAYVSREDNLNVYKGKLLVNEHIKKNTAHSERFYVCYDEYLVNRAENRLIKTTLQKLQNLSNSAENQKEIRQLLTAFELVDPSLNYEKDFSQVVIDRNTKDYDMLMHWSKVFLMNKSFTTFSGDHHARALLFPMEKVFEAYVAQELKKNLGDLRWTVATQAKQYYLFDNPQRFRLQPDIVITRDDESQVILDTKWKRLINDPRKNYGISQADMYQMYAYSKKYHSSEIWLLYPMDKETKGLDRISFQSKDDVHVNVFFIDVAKIEASLEELRGRLMNRES